MTDKDIIFKPKASYRKTYETVVTRVTHEVRIFTGDCLNVGPRVLDIIDSLKHAPQEARLKEWDEDDGDIVLTFVEEKQQSG